MLNYGKIMGKGCPLVVGVSFPPLSAWQPELVTSDLDLGVTLQVVSLAIEMYLCSVCEIPAGRCYKYCGRGGPPRFLLCPLLRKRPSTAYYFSPVASFWGALTSALSVAAKLFAAGYADGFPAVVTGQLQHLASRLHLHFVPIAVFQLLWRICSFAFPRLGFSV